MSEDHSEHAQIVDETIINDDIAGLPQLVGDPLTPIPAAPLPAPTTAHPPYPNPETPLPLISEVPLLTTAEPVSEPGNPATPLPPTSALARITRPLAPLARITKPLAPLESTQQDTSPELPALSAEASTPATLDNQDDSTTSLIDESELTALDPGEVEEQGDPRESMPTLAELDTPPDIPSNPTEPVTPPDVSSDPTEPVEHTEIALAASLASTEPSPLTSPTAPLEHSEPALAISPITSLEDTKPRLTALPTTPFKRSKVLPVIYSPQQAFSSRTMSLDARQRKLQRIYRLQYFSRKHMRRARIQERREKRHLWTAIWSTSTSFLLLFLVLVGVISYIAYDFINTTQGTYASQVLTLRDLLPPDNLKIYGGQGNLIDQLTDQGIHTEVKYNQVAPDLVNATVAIEDRTFWTNQGYDIMGILRSAMADLESNQPLEGGSTITQQLIKQLIVGNSSSAIRKLSELTLAPQVNNHYSKQDIMEMYLNTIYYGYQAYGIDAAATVYFGLEDQPGHSAASQLDLAQAALLAGLPRNASLYDPFLHPQTTTTRFYSVLEAMVAQGSITQVQAQNAYQEEQGPTFFKSSPTLQDQAPHFDDYVITQLEQMFHLKRNQLSRSGLVVYTTVNVSLQNQIQKIMQQHIAEIRAAHHVTNAAEVLIDFHTGAIISMLGSLDYNNNSIDGQYNVALAYRQPGSSFKPYVYVTAFAQGASPAQAVDDARTTFNTPGGNPPNYTPNNYDNRFHGQMTLRCALQNSLNVPAVRVLQHVGIDNAMNTAKAMGITSYEGVPGYSLVLGGLDIRLLDHTSAMGVFANGGVRQPYYSISKVVQGTTSKVLFQHQAAPGTQVITPQLSYMMTNVLSDNTSRIPEFFDCNVLQLYANSQQSCYQGNRGAVRPAAAKTGTTQDFRDNWTVGYTTDFVMGVWAGNDDNSQMINVTGVQGAAPIWHDAMLLAEQGHPIQDFQNPGGLTRATVTYADGVTSTDWFLPGTVPASHAAPTPTPGDNPFPILIPPVDNGSDAPTPAPYCSTYSFAFPPPPGGGIPAGGGWW